jgi:hypothetical protein
VVARRDRPSNVGARSSTVLVGGALCLVVAALAMPGASREAGRSAASPVQATASGGAEAVGPGAAAPVPEIRVDRSSFWYEEGPSCAGLARLGLPCAPRGTADRVARAVEAAIRDRPEDFPQPPPLPVVVRAHPPERLPDTLQSLADVYSYGGAELVGGVVVIDVNLIAFIGDTPLNDAELRSFLAHEMVHAYQYAGGPTPKNSPELWRREVAAFDWELLHMEPGVRSWYRAEAIFNRDMYRRLLEEP